MPEYTPNEPDSWTWPDSYDDPDEYEECPYCDGEGWQRLNDTMLMECPECGGDGYL